MSLFPAYSGAETQTSSTDEPQGVSKEEWLKNESFVSPPAVVVLKVPEATENLPAKRARSRSLKYHKKKDKKEAKTPPDLSKQAYLQSLSVNFYEERTGNREYLRVPTLRQPARPSYARSRFPLFGRHFASSEKNFKRYFLSSSLKKLSKEPKTEKFDVSDEEEVFRKHLRSNPNDVEEWLKYLRFKEIGPSSYQREKSKLEVAEKAMRLNPESEVLLKEYLETLPKVHPTDEVLEIVQGLLNKEPHTYQLWLALIYNKQASMAQCIIPDVLKLYEKCMTTLFSVIKSDEMLVKIFKNCAVFMRQSGLWEQFFGIIHLALSLNVSSTAFSNSVKFYSAENNKVLLDYEELILKSGLPMNEIWLRIEKLRSAFNFLPCVGSSVTSDPQRMVLNEDICHYIFPLINHNYKFDFFIMVLKLLKFPFDSSLVQMSSFLDQEIYEYDNIEDVLPVLLSAKRDVVLEQILYGMARDMNVPPSFINSNLAYEAFVEVLLEIIQAASNCFSTKQNLIIFRLYLRLERVLVVLERLKNSEIPKEMKKKVKSRIKKAIKSMRYEENLLVYNDFAWIEYEMEGSEAAEGVFRAAMQQNFIDTVDFMTLMLSYVEILLGKGETERAVEYLTEASMGKVDFQDSQVLSSKKIVALQKQSELMKLLLEIEGKSDIFEIEDCFTRSRFLLVLKSHILYVVLIKTPNEAVEKLRLVLEAFPEKSQKHTYLREQVFEIASFVHQFQTSCVLNSFVFEGLKEFPHNTTLLKVAATSFSTPWMNLRAVLTRTLTTNSLIFAIVACRYRISHLSETGDAYKNREINILKDATDTNSKIRRNSLVWRLYLRALFNVNSNQTLIKCKNTLYEALDVCPWSKALYLDGSFYAPQELSQLLDLIIEKQLRIHALPEELTILRN